MATPEQFEAIEVSLASFQTRVQVYEEKVAANRAKALAKLQTLGLTEAEIKALMS